MPQIFRPNANVLSRIIIVVSIMVVLVGAGVAIALNHSPYTTGLGAVPAQPVPFSHQHHVGGLGIDCRYCHVSVERSPFAGLPDTNTCMTCHSQLWTNADMLAPVRESLQRDEPLAWRRVYDLADFVYFNHRAHVDNGVGCEVCHGRVDTMPLTRQATPLTMQWCLECHRNPAPLLRHRGKITAMGVAPVDKQTGQQLLQHYDIDTARLIECDVCHR